MSSPPLSPLRKFLLIMILAGPIAYAFSVVVHSQTLAALNPATLYFWVMVALTEETVKWVLVRQIRFWNGLYFILAISTLESIVYALYAEVNAFPYTLLTVWGVWFWYVFVVRFIFNGHVLLYLSAVGVTRVSNRAPSELQSFFRKSGRNVNIAGWLFAILGHTYWNWMQVLSVDQGPFMLLVGALVIWSLIGLWISGALKPLYEYT